MVEAQQLGSGQRCPGGLFIQGGLGVEGNGEFAK